jgi:ribose 5-phosphate isomerase A
VNQEDEKLAVAAYALRFVRDKIVLGLGTGTTSRHFVQLLAERVRAEAWSIVGVATSLATAELARQLGLEVESIDDVERIDLYVDGADQISTSGAIVKGGGGALLGEKIVAANSQERVYIADGSKLAGTLGGVPLPVEVVPFGHEFTGRRIRRLGADAVLRTSEAGPFRTDSGHFIYDCKFENMADPAGLSGELHNIAGVVETGLFLGLDGVVVTIVDGRVVERRGPPFAWES